MKSVEEHQVFAAVVGMQINTERLGKIAIHIGRGVGEYADCEAFVIGDLSILEEKMIKRFRITDALKKQWAYGGILFRVYLFIRNGILIGGHIFKYKVSSEDQCCDAGYETSPTQQEIRITHKILQYLVEKNP
jgi:hypothetical protein